MPFRCVIIPINVHGTDEFDTRVICGYEYDGLLQVIVLVVWVRLSHDDVKLAPRITGPRDPPFVTVDDDFIAFATNRGLDVGGIRRGNLGIS
jgi:hypothetical protein